MTRLKIPLRCIDLILSLMALGDAVTARRRQERVVAAIFTGTGSVLTNIPLFAASFGGGRGEESTRPEALGQGC